MVLDSDEESEGERSINIQGPINIYREHSINASNRINKETRNINSGRAIRDDPLRLNLNIPENFDNLNDKIIYTPRNTNQMENVKTLPTSSDLISENQSQDSHIILVHSTDTSYTLSNTQILLNESILDNNNYGTIERGNEQAPSIQTRSRLQNENILNSGIYT